MEKLTIGKVAKITGVSLDTMRFYEREGLINPSRTEAGYRLYDQKSLARLRFIKRAKGLGFTLREIGELLDLRHNPSTTKAEIKTQALAKITDVEEKIIALSQIKEALVHLAEACSGHGALDDCPILAALDNQEDSDHGTENCCS